MFTKFFGFVDKAAANIMKAAKLGITILILAAAFRFLVVAGDYMIASTNNKRSELIKLNRESDLITEQSLTLMKMRSPIIKGPDSPEPVSHK